MGRRLRGILLIFLVLAACNSGSSSQPPDRITVFAAASLTEAFTDAAPAVADVHPTFSFGASGTLAAQVQQGAPADVIATADTATMQKLVDAGLVDQPVVFARNRLEIIVAPGNPKAIRGLADLARPDVTVVLADPSVPAGRYARQILTNADVDVTPKSLEPDVKAAVARVTADEADAAIVYASDVRAAGERAAGVELPEAANVLAEYPIAIVKATSHRAAAQRFVDAITRGPGRAALERAGFVTAP